MMTRVEIERAKVQAEKNLTARTHLAERKEREAIRQRLQEEHKARAGERAINNVSVCSLSDSYARTHARYP